MELGIVVNGPGTIGRRLLSNPNPTEVGKSYYFKRRIL
jgi:hypothetical protein